MFKRSKPNAYSTTARAERSVYIAPEDAISYLEKKGFKIGWDWHETLDNAHSKAFTVAKVARMDLLQDIRQSLITAMQQGQSLEQWKASITPTLPGQRLVGKENCC